MRPQSLSGGMAERIYEAKDFDRMIQETKPEVVIITTKDATHSQYIIRAMELGCDVMTEKPMTTDEVDALLAEPKKFESAEATRDAAMLELMYSTGMRVTELVSLNMDSLHLHPAPSWVLCLGKGSKERTLPVAPRAIESLEAQLRQPFSDEEFAVFSRVLAALPDPVGEITNLRRRPTGISVGQMRVPLGVFGMIYESRPNVTIEAASLAIKSGNACILRGGSEAIHSNLALWKLVQQALTEAGLPATAVQLVETTDRAAVGLVMFTALSCVPPTPFDWYARLASTCGSSCEWKYFIAMSLFSMVFFASFIGFWLFLNTVLVDQRKEPVEDTDRSGENLHPGVSIPLGKLLGRLRLVLPMQSINGFLKLCNVEIDVLLDDGVVL